MWKKFSQETKKIIIGYYGVPGHGKGLVDSMSGFGVKTLLRREIVTKDIFFSGSAGMSENLKKLFEDDHTKHDINLEKNKFSEIEAGEEIVIQLL